MDETGKRSTGQKAPSALHGVGKVLQARREREAREREERLAEAALKPPPDAQDPEKPNETQVARGMFSADPVIVPRDGDQIATRAYRRVPHFLRLGLGEREEKALRHYRSVFDKTERSATKSCLHIRPRTTNPDDEEPDGAQESMALAREELRQLEAPLGNLVHTMRSIALQDMSYSELAIARYGSRTRSWILVDKPVIENGQYVRKNGKLVKRAFSCEQIVPKSWRHSDAIKREFFEGIAKLVRAVERMGK